MEKEESKILQELTTEVKLTNRRIEEIGCDVKENRESINSLIDVVRGDGGKDGVAQTVREIARSVIKLQGEVEGTGDKDNPGLMERMSFIEKWVESRVWFERLIIGLLASEFIALGYIIVKHVLIAP